jgi:hypothetical protein
VARESALWQRCKTGVKHLNKCGFKTHFCRLENEAGSGNPDVDGCIDGIQVWLELKSCDRPARPTSLIRPRCRLSQEVWHRERSHAGCRTNFVLIQVGEARESRLYLIPGNRYAEIKAVESYLEAMSVLTTSNCSIADMLMRATEGY